MQMTFLLVQTVSRLLLLSTEVTTLEELKRTEERTKSKGSKEMLLILVSWIG